MSRAAAVLALMLAGCHPRARVVTALPPLGAEGEVQVYLEPLPRDAGRLSFSMAELAAVRADGEQVPLALARPEVSAAESRRQRLIATGRLPPGPYAGFALLLRRAAVSGEDGTADLVVPKEPVRLEVPFQLGRGRSALVNLAVREGLPLQTEFGPDAFTGHVLSPENTIPQRAGYCSRPDQASLAVFDRHDHRITGVLPTGAGPTGLAVDVNTGRAYVALRGEDQVQVIDLSTGEELVRIHLRAGDEPTDLALAPDGVVLVANPGSNTVAFVDPVSGSQLERVAVGLEPWRLRLDRDGRRAYVLGRRSGDVTVVDVAGRAVARTAATDPEPLAAQLNHAGTRLYVVHRGSAYLTVLSLPDLMVVNRLFIGLGAGALEIDPRTDLVYVGRADERTIQVFDPVSLAPLDRIELPAPVSYLAVDRIENALLAVMPSAGAVAFVDLASRQVVSAVDVGVDPYRVAMPLERR